MNIWSQESTRRVYGRGVFLQGELVKKAFLRDAIFCWMKRVRVRAVVGEEQEGSPGVISYCS